MSVRELTPASDAGSRDREKAAPRDERPAVQHRQRWYHRALFSESISRAAILTFRHVYSFSSRDCRGPQPTLSAHRRPFRTRSGSACTHGCACSVCVLTLWQSFPATEIKRPALTHRHDMRRLALLKIGSLNPEVEVRDSERVMLAQADIFREEISDRVDPVSYRMIVAPSDWWEISVRSFN